MREQSCNRRTAAPEWAAGERTQRPGAFAVASKGAWPPTTRSPLGVTQGKRRRRPGGGRTRQGGDPTPNPSPSTGRGANNNGRRVPRLRRGWAAEGRSTVRAAVRMFSGLE